MAKKKEKMVLIEVDEKAVKIGLFFGLMFIADDGVPEMTEKGSDWFHEHYQRTLRDERLKRPLKIDDPSKVDF